MRLYFIRFFVSFIQNMRAFMAVIVMELSKSNHIIVIHIFLLIRSLTTYKLTP